jgi:D-glycero-D-manno-heptose 1,7-bisphosphate phosphatase
LLNKPVIFLDRDGVINRDSPDYIKSWVEFAFLPGSLEALRLLTAKGHRLILITNQSIINRGMVPLEVLNDIHQRMCRSVAEAGGRITDIFFCPHRPDENCDCRKPKPGLIQQAIQRYDLDPADAIMIGDNAKDIMCGRNAGCGATMLVQTGNGLTTGQELADRRIAPDHVVPDLLHGARLILSRHLAPAGS